jgi:hypothetical protein
MTWLEPIDHRKTQMDGYTEKEIPAEINTSKIDR